jgi:hypothetical protein
MSPTDELTQWQYLANEAKAGRLTLDPHAAQVYHDACAKLMSRLFDVRQQFGHVDRITGLGGFDCAAQLEGGLTKLVDGSEGSVPWSLDQYISVAKLISETVSHSIRKTVQQDEASGSSIASTG